MVLVQLVLLGQLGSGCHGRGSGELEPPPGADLWQGRYARVFDDGYTREVVQLSGRAPNDVYDQRLVAARLGYADVVLVVEVEQVWARGRYQGRPHQFLGIRVQDVLMGELPRRTNEQQLIPIAENTEVPGSLRGTTMILFLRWAPGASPPYHHHLAPADEPTLGWVKALIEHAREEGVLDRKGRPRSRARH